jgi:hypothetical protein
MLKDGLVNEKACAPPGECGQLVEPLCHVIRQADRYGGHGGKPPTTNDVRQVLHTTGDDESVDGYLLDYP